MEAKTSALRPTRGLWSGFQNLVGKENGEWLSGGTWLVYGVIWLMVVAGVPSLLALIAVYYWPEAISSQVHGFGASAFFILNQIAAVTAVVVSTQGTIVGEKQNGTAEWILSKPVSRKALVLSKVVVHLGWLLVVTLLVPATALYICIFATSGLPLPLLPFLGGVGMMALNLLFYLSLSILSGTLFENRGAIAGVVFSFIVAGYALSHFDEMPQLALNLFPWLLFGFSSFLVAGDGLPVMGLIAIVATTTWSILFVLLALWRFERAEF